jgi:hypothetical protein
LLHPLDFLGCDDLDELAFFPAMMLPGEEKLRVVSEILRLYSDQYTVRTLKQYALLVDESLLAQTIEEDPGSEIVGKEQEVPL